MNSLYNEARRQVEAERRATAAAEEARLAQERFLASARPCRYFTSDAANQLLHEFADAMKLQGVAMSTAFELVRLPRRHHSSPSSEQERGEVVEYGWNLRDSWPCLFVTAGAQLLEVSEFLPTPAQRKSPRWRRVITEFGDHGSYLVCRRHTEELIEPDTVVMPTSQTETLRDLLILRLKKHL